MGFVIQLTSELLVITDNDLLKANFEVTLVLHGKMKVDGSKVVVKEMR